VYICIYVMYICSGVHPASYPVGILPEGKAAWAWTWPLTSI